MRNSLRKLTGKIIQLTGNSLRGIRELLSRCYCLNADDDRKEFRHMKILAIDVSVGPTSKYLPPARSRSGKSFLALYQGRQEHQQISHPNNGQPKVGIPFGLGIFLRLRDP